MVLIEIVSGDNPDAVYMFWSMRMRASQTGGGVLVVALDDGDLEQREFPPIKFDGRWTAVHD